MADFTRRYLHDNCNGIDASLFSSDDFIDEANRERLRFYMERWQKQLLVWEAIESECSEDDTSPPPPSNDASRPTEGYHYDVDDQRWYRGDELGPEASR